MKDDFVLNLPKYVVHKEAFLTLAPDRWIEDEVYNLN
jgi:hypothetical protein